MSESKENRNVNGQGGVYMLNAYCSVHLNYIYWTRTGLGFLIRRDEEPCLIAPRVRTLYRLWERCSVTNDWRVRLALVSQLI